MLSRAVTSEETILLREQYPNGLMEDQLIEARDLLEGKTKTPLKLVSVG